MGLTQRHGALLYRCGDMPLYVAMREHPKYAHYVMIEDDVELRGEDASPVNALCRALSGAPLDFVGIIFRPDRTQVWGRTTADVYGAENAHLARFPMVAVSRRLCAYLFSQRLLEAARNPEPADIMHCEVFAASAAMAAGFACADLNAVMPGSYDRSIMMFESPGFGLPMGAVFDGAPAIKFYHPVYEPASWLRRTKALFLQPNKRAPQRLINLTKCVNEARARGDQVMVEAVEQLAHELPPDFGNLLMGAYRECRLEAPPAGDDEIWGEARKTHSGFARLLRGDEARWLRLIDGDGATKVYVYLPVVRELTTDPDGSWLLEVNGKQAPALWNWHEGRIYALLEAPADTIVEIRLLAAPEDAAAEPKRGQRALALLCENPA
jgi:hypothetical protein